MRLSLILFLFFVLLCTTSYGQTGLVRNINTENPLVGATIYAIRNEKGTISDQYGVFALELDKFPDTLVVSYLGYQQKLIPITGQIDQIIVELDKDVAVLPDIVVQAYRQPKRLSPEKYTITDFEIIGEYAFLLLYASRKPHYRLRKTDLNGSLLQELELGNINPRDGLFRSCLGGLYVIYEKKIIEILHQSDSLQLGAERDIADYTLILKPCLLADDRYYYTGYHKLQKQAFTIYASIADTQQQVLIEIRNEAQIIRLADEDIFLQNKARSLEGQANERIRLANMLADEKSFAARVIYAPVNVQLIRYQMELFVFDFVSHQIHSFSSDLLPQQEVPFILHKRKPRQARIIQDAVTSKCYTITRDRKYSYVYELDPRTGILREVAVIPAIYLKKVQIQSGILYYLHRGITFEDRWQYLYQIAIE